MIFTISGPSGVGKSVITKFLLKNIPDLALLPSYTTRLPDARDLFGEYIYVNDEEFLRLIEQNVFAWHVEVHGNRYGTKSADIVGDRIAMVTLETARDLRTIAQRKKVDEVISLYIYCNDYRILKSRLIGRGEKDVERRLRDCHSWNLDALQHKFLVWIDNSGELGDTYVGLANALKQFDITISNAGL